MSVQLQQISFALVSRDGCICCYLKHRLNAKVLSIVLRYRCLLGETVIMSQPLQSSSTSRMFELRVMITWSSLFIELFQNFSASPEYLQYNLRKLCWNKTLLINERLWRQLILLKPLKRQAYLWEIKVVEIINELQDESDKVKSEIDKLDEVAPRYILCRKQSNQAG